MQNDSLSLAQELSGCQPEENRVCDITGGTSDSNALGRSVTDSLVTIGGSTKVEE